MPRLLATTFGVPCLVAAAVLHVATYPVHASDRLHVGFAHADITPDLESGRPVWLAGYAWGRRATGVHDPLFARTVVMSDGERTLAVVSVDVVGLQYPTVEAIRKQLNQFDYVLVTSTHNHEGPDTIGIWGATPIQRGVDDEYLEFLVRQVVHSVNVAKANLRPVSAQLGVAENPTLLGDSRKPVAKDGVLRVIKFAGQDDGQPAGLLVQWNCHPEALGPKNTLLTADFCATTVKQLQERFNCPVVYCSGAVGGLMAPPDHQFKDADGKELREGQFAYAEAYGAAVADLATSAIEKAEPIELTPFQICAAPVSIPVDNPLYRTAKLVGVVRRPSLMWTGDFREVKPFQGLARDGRFAVKTEVACLRFGALVAACIPGEIYPELVYGSFQDPAEQHVDFPEAPLEPTVQDLIPHQQWMLFGLANDEIGYIIPKRQWDHAPPYAYGRNKSQYGEVNSCSPDVAPIIMQALAEQLQRLELSEAAETP